METPDTDPAARGSEPTPSAAGEGEAAAAATGADLPPAQQKQQAKGKGRARGRGRAKAAKVTKAAPKPGGAPGRGRARRIFDSAKVQAAHERTLDLKAKFSELAKSIKPALLHLAQRTIDKLKTDPKAHEQEPEFRDVMATLDQRLEEALEQARAKEQMEIAAARHECAASYQKAEEALTARTLLFLFFPLT